MTEPVLEANRAEVETPAEALPLVFAPQRDLATALVTTLPERGLDRMTSKKIESVLCTSALTAHI
jgi:hypothetical protein